MAIIRRGRWPGCHPKLLHCLIERPAPHPFNGVSLNLALNIESRTSTVVLWPVLIHFPAFFL